ncbi:MULTISPECIES: ISAs1 family transposase [unclassified Streptomyces]|uniref:ISAs1 family transposase n=1 Tax=unclassified Streptomyces TaxID=2593676 RepID=UPI002255A0B7|nr:MULTISPECIES: ISAs1 family transposase [unclassified Streptomyces]MCX4642000.1 ISAs1 family transposase [Streptomyces sp. NBC_01446]MCX4642003.1 ISAs1 family transposase [Streptomyces sp. NBC_01446]MCX5326873.1 ISAs1 family transposase [Streptomyces sp. NBC_00120]
MLTKLGPLGPGDVADLRPFLESVPDPRSRRGRWYSLVSILLVCAAAAVSGARSVDELAEWGARADAGVLQQLGVRRHPLRWRHAPSRSAIGRVLERLDGDALDAAVSAWLARRHRETTPVNEKGDGRPQRRAIAVDGKSLRGSARLDRPRRHLLSAVTHERPLTLAQAEIGAKTNETTHFKPLLEPLDLHGDVITFDALHSVKANVSWLVEVKQAHYIAVTKTNQSTCFAQLDGLDWMAVPIQHTASNTGHGRRESRSIKAVGIDDNLGGIAFPHARLALRVHRRRKQTGKKETRETVYAVTSLDAHQATPAELASHLRGHWAVENSSHHIRDVTFDEDASTVHAGTAPRAMATLRNLAIGTLKAAGAANIAKVTRAIRDNPSRALPILGITRNPTHSGT